MGERGVYGAEFGWAKGGGPGVCGVCPGMADKRLTPDLLIARIAARQHGVVAVSQLLRSGLTATRSLAASGLDACIPSTAASTRSATTA